MTDTKIDIVVRLQRGGTTYEVQEVRSQELKDREVNVGDILTDTEFEDLLDMGYTIKTQ